MFNHDNKRQYIAPVIETMSVRVERGFQSSGSTAPSGSPTTSYNEGATWN